MSLYKALKFIEPGRKLDSPIWLMVFFCNFMRLLPLYLPPTPVHPTYPHRLRKLRGASTLAVQKLYSLYSCIKIVQPLFKLERL